MRDLNNKHTHRLENPLRFLTSSRLKKYQINCNNFDGHQLSIELLSTY